MKINIVIDEKELKELVFKRVRELITVGFDDIHIEFLVKSKQNYKSEWEKADFKAEISYDS